VTSVVKGLGVAEFMTMEFLCLRPLCFYQMEALALAEIVRVNRQGFFFFFLINA